MATAELDRVLEQARTIAIAQASLMSDVLFDNVLHIMRSITTSKKAPLWVQHAEAGLRQNQLAAQQGRSDLTQQMSREEETSEGPGADIRDDGICDR
ncbi:uncharacterized protein HMPREF1541_09256 [Cyphellophora europaea CBS 101466]|uniref:Uncharacterized protein n=1 Tax=Cyphellophora europaea (strain CBS 101466) TaxID=1220924 RepID=W2S9X6_CYPE1|nr:uncharacterized protein HMPREF1541_09256 [Cyphellophora europaea CBS 101466]ETN45425.1 hypothetical protein HMPREF1541_09256 [Cyphellophora europaea CBS 101466]